MNERAFVKVDKADFYRFVTAPEQCERRYEFERGRIVQQMTGGTKRHHGLAQRFVQIIISQISPARWDVLTDRGVETEQSVRYPDVIVEPRDEDGDSLATTRPALIIEVLSPSSTARDLDVKPSEYMSLASLHAYIVASQDEPACLVWLRGADGNFPAEPGEMRGYQGTIDIRALSLVIPLGEVYRGLVPEG